MKKILLFSLFFCSMVAYAQDFSFQLLFTDADGNKDSITLGYDSLATIGLDTAFGEQNIINQPIKPGLDVRISDEWHSRTILKKTGTYHSKKQILNYVCKEYPKIVQTIDIHTKNWPVTVSWDSTMFTEKCREGSVFSGLHEDEWWYDIIPPSNLYRVTMLETNEQSFKSNVRPNSSPNFGYVDEQGDTVSTFWFAFGDSSLLAVYIEDPIVNNNSILAIPNPARTHIKFEFLNGNRDIEQIEIYDAVGQKMLSTGSTDNIDISQLPGGLYIIRARDKYGPLKTGKFIKI